VEKAESVLLEIRRLIDEQKISTVSDQFFSDVKRLSDEFYVHLPHDNKHRTVIYSKQLIARKQQLCQVCFYVIIATVVTHYELHLFFVL